MEECPYCLLLRTECVCEGMVYKPAPVAKTMRCLPREEHERLLRVDAENAVYQQRSAELHARIHDLTVENEYFRKQIVLDLERAVSRINDLEEELVVHREFDAEQELIARQVEELINRPPQVVPKLAEAIRRLREQDGKSISLSIDADRPVHPELGGILPRMLKKLDRGHAGVAVACLMFALYWWYLTQFGAMR